MNSAALNSIALLASADLTRAEQLLARIPNDDPGDFAGEVAAGIKSGRYVLADVWHGAARVGITVWFVETMQDGAREFVSVATYAGNPGTPLREEIEAALLELARAQNCRSVRMHTARHGLVKLALARGWHVGEIILRKNLA